jgi:[acyl-carrier-protein] S-malonyltransferase
MKSYLFPGQGAQSADMATEIISKFPGAIALYESARAVTGIDLVHLSVEMLSQTRFSQLAIIVHSIACLQKHCASLSDPSPVAMAGFSLGEYTALYAAGVIEYSDLLELVNKRADLMQSAAEKNPGAMYAIIGLPEKTIEDTLQEYHHVYSANYNCPGQLVIAGEIESAGAAAEKLLSMGARRAHRLQVNGAFHTPMMCEAAAELRTYASSITFSSPKSPLYSNATAMPVPENTDFAEYLSTHMISPVRFTDEIRRMRNDGYDTYIELGPGHVLSGLVKRI